MHIRLCVKLTRSLRVLRRRHNHTEPVILVYSQNGMIGVPKTMKKFWPLLIIIHFLLKLALKSRNISLTSW